LFASSLANRPGSTRLHGNLGVALMDAGRWAAADRQLRTALVLDPTNAEAHHNLGLVLASAGRPREAEAEFREALALRPGMRVALAALCLLLEGRDRHEEALPVCDAAARKGADVACARWRIETGGRCLAPPADLSEPPPG
jgi:Flp pilus assembly protein TadD